MICIKFILVYRIVNLLLESFDLLDCDYKWFQIYLNYNMEEYVYFFFLKMFQLCKRVMEFI